MALDEQQLGRTSLSAAMIAGSALDGTTSDTRLVSEALYGMYLLSRRSMDLELSRKEASTLRGDDSLSTSAGSEVSEAERHERLERLESFEAVAPPPGLETMAPPPGLEDSEAMSVPMETPEADGFFGLMAWTATLPLSSHLLGLLSSRRGKQRLRSVEQQSGAQLMLDETWHVLHLAGTCPTIYKAQELLEIMEGFTVGVSSAMWTELMRCRREDEDTNSPLTLSKVQEIVGYRVHVERDSLALRIFGPKSMESSAEILIQRQFRGAARLEELCVKEVLKLPEDCDWNEIKELQKYGNLTLRVEGGFVELEGIQSAVLEMKEELRQRLKVTDCQDPQPTSCGHKPRPW